MFCAVVEATAAAVAAAAPSATSTKTLKRSSAVTKGEEYVSVGLI